MGKSTGISWTDHTFNPWWGCEKVSPGCDRCYAERDSKRFGQAVWGKDSPRRFFGQKHWRQPLSWSADALEDRVRRRVFCASMADVFEDRADLVRERLKIWDLVRITPNLDWQILTKRPENFRRFLPEEWLAHPPRNVWLGVTAENQRRADERIPILLSTPAAVRWVSYEPAIGPINFRQWLGEAAGTGVCDACGQEAPRLSVINCSVMAGVCVCYRCVPRLDWIIVGGESGPGARIFNIEWARSTIRQCREAGVACFVKQLGEKAAVRPDDKDALNRMQWQRDKKYADPSEWPEDLRVQEFPR